MAQEHESRLGNSQTVAGSLSVLIELQHLLYEIARQAEWGAEGSLETVRVRSEHALKLIDSCLLSAQVELGQTSLPFSPYGVGSIMHEAAYDLQKASRTTVKVVASAHQPASTNGQMLQSFFYAAGHFIAGTGEKSLVMKSFSGENGNVGVGVFTENFDVSAAELRRSLSLMERSKMPLAAHSQRSGVFLLLADTFASILGTPLEIKRLHGLKGIATTLPRSRQLSLIQG